MNLRKYIVILLIMLGAWSTVVSGQDYSLVVCPGDTGVDYHVQGTAGSTYEWTVNGGTIARNYGDSIIVDWGMVPGIFEITVQEISQFGCYAVPKSVGVMISAPDINLGDDTYVCSEESMTFRPIGDFYSFEWQDGSTLPTFTASEEGFISCKVSDTYGCFWKDSVYLEVKPLPYIELGNDTSLCGEQYLDISGGYDAIDFSWSTGEISPSITVYQGYKEISVIVEDDFGCINYDSIVIDDCDPGVFFKDIPTAITPNGDGINDEWRIEKLEAYSEAVVDIYDRWGNLVFKSEPGYPNGWDGRNARGDLVPLDSYHFVILLNFGDDDRIIGTITVVR
jgi:gliding motility-associated-like protein